MRNDAYTFTVFLLVNGVLYSEPAHGDWYCISSNATNIFLTTANDTTQVQPYLPLEPASPLSCAQQHQSCNAEIQESGGCGPLASIRDALAGAAPLFDTTITTFPTSDAKSEKAARFQYSANDILSSQRQTSAILDQLGPKALLSQRGLIEAFQEPLDPNQRQLDIIYIWNNVYVHRADQDTERIRTPSGSGHRADQDTERIRTPSGSGHRADQDTERIIQPRQLAQNATFPNHNAVNQFILFGILFSERFYFCLTRFRIMPGFVANATAPRARFDTPCATTVLTLFLLYLRNYVL
jgi:hypothetical protein